MANTTHPPFTSELDFSTVKKKTIIIIFLLKTRKKKHCKRTCVFLPIFSSLSNDFGRVKLTMYYDIDVIVITFSKATFVSLLKIFLVSQ